MSFTYKKDKKKRGTEISDRRISFSIFIFFVLFSVYLGRALQISLFSPELKKKAEIQRKSVIVLKGKRGNILAQDKVMAEDIPAYSVWINPLSISKDEGKIEAVHKIAKEINVPSYELKSKLEKKLYFQWLKRQLSQQEYSKVLELIAKFGLKESDIGFLKEWKRFYPYGEITAHITGFVNVDSEGLSGIELTYDDYLKGGSIKVPVLRDALGRIIMRFPPQEPPRGNSVKTTIDIDLQTMLYKEMKEAMDNLKAKGAFAVAIRPKTGEILALVSLPSFDPNGVKVIDTRIFSRFHQLVFEPGSTFKVFTLAVALESGAVSKDDVFYCHNGEWKFQNKVINDTEKIGYASLKEILAHSSNICAAQIALLIGKKVFWEYLTKLGFGSKVQIGLPGEESGIFRHWRKWYDLDLASLGFGHFIGVTPIQIAAAFSVFVNDGYIVKPYLISSVFSPFGEKIYEHTPEIRSRVFSEKTVELMKEYLRAVVVLGTGRRAEIPLYLSAGKTGTSKKIENGVYTTKYISSFIGFAPFENPEVVLYVGFDEPQGIYYGGQVAAPIFSSVLKNYFAHKMIPPPSEEAYAFYNKPVNNSNAKQVEYDDRLSTNSYPSSQSLNSSGDGEVKNVKEPFIIQRRTLNEFLASLPEEKRRSKKIIVNGYGFVSRIEEKEKEIFVFLSP
jgi:cell division protein FtsI (penicillin-binding protein 3)